MTEVLTTSNYDEKISKGVTLVDFYADWCGPCKMVAPIIDELAEEVNDANIVKVDVDESPEIAARFSVRSIPTFIVLKDGELVDQQAGARGDKGFFLDLINKANESYN